MAATTNNHKHFFRQPTIAELEAAQARGIVTISTPWIHISQLAEILADLKGNL
jgi:hypothetical protein